MRAMVIQDTRMYVCIVRRGALLYCHLAMLALGVIFFFISGELPSGELPS